VTSASTALVDPRANTIPPEVAGLQSKSLWIGSKELAALAAISERKAREALDRAGNGATWRGYQLETRIIEGAGGRGGKALQVYVPSLLPDLRDKWFDQHRPEQAPALPAADPLPAPSTFDPRITKEFAEWRWKVDLLSPALSHPKRSHARGEELRRLARKEHPGPHGETVHPSLTTLRAWLKDLEENKPRKRREQNIPRVIVNRIWDAACPLPAEQKAKIREVLDTYLATAWAKGVPGVNRVIQFATSKLVELSREHGWADANLENCNIGRYLAEQYREYLSCNSGPMP